MGTRNYTGSGYRLVNGPLRSNKVMSLRAARSIFDDLMADMRPLQDDHIVYRGYRSLRKEYKVGDAIKELGFVSTSKDPNTSTAGYFFRQNGVLVQIRVRKGQNAIITNAWPSAR